MKSHYYEVIADLRFRITKATEELTLLDATHNQIAARRVELQTNIAGMNELAEELEEFIAQTEPPTPEPEEPKPFRLEVGKRYVLRDGTVTAPLSYYDSPTFPFTDGTTTWTKDGHYFDGGKSKWDIIAEYADPLSGIQRP